MTEAFPGATQMQKRDMQFIPGGEEQFPPRGGHSGASLKVNGSLLGKTVGRQRMVIWAENKTMLKRHEA